MKKAAKLLELPRLAHNEQGLTASHMHLNRIARPVAALAIGWILSSSSCVSYPPEPLHPEQSERAFNERMLGSIALRDQIRRGASPVESEPTTQGSDVSGLAWDLDSLTRAAILLHRDMEVARAHLAATRAGRATAGEMPNPSIQFAPEYATNPGGITPWIWGFSLDIPIETAGKRRIRIAQSEALSDAGRMELAETAWHVRSRLRDALADFLLTQAESKLWEQEVAGRSAYLNVLDIRLKAGEAGRAELDIARVDLLTARQSRLAALGRAEDSRNKLASAIGLPTSGLGDAQFVWPGIDQFEPLDRGAARALQAAGLLNRMDIRRSLSEYAATEAALHLEIAKQYPDLHFTPGYLFDQAVNKIQLGLTLALPILNQNGGAIGEAVAHRAESGQKFLALQAQVIAETESAVTRYRSALAELKNAESQIAQIQRQLEVSQLALKIGEQDRLAVSGLEVQHNVARRLRLDAIRKARAARSAIEDAIERPLPGALPTTQISPPATQPRQPATTQSSAHRKDSLS